MQSRSDRCLLSFLVSLKRLLSFFYPDGTAELNTALAEELVSESKTTPSVKRSNCGGWHSKPDLADRDTSSFAELHRIFLRQLAVVMNAVGEATQTAELPAYAYEVHSWAMVMSRNDYTVLHDHADAHWSFVYYVDAGDADVGNEPDSGQLSFVDPRGGTSKIPGLDLFPSLFSIAPETGMLVIVPGWLQHFVRPYRGTRPRISIASNVNLVLSKRE